MQIRLCSATKADQTPCRAVAATGSPFCGAHRTLHKRNQRIQRSRRAPAIHLGPLQDRGSIQRALGRVIQGLASGSLNPDRAPAMLNRLQAAVCLLDHQDGRKPQSTSLEPPSWLLDLDNDS